MDKDIEQKVCPNCQNHSLRKRSDNSLKNIRLREIGNRHSPIVCDNCRTTYKYSLVETGTSSVDIEQNSGIDW